MSDELAADHWATWTRGYYKGRSSYSYSATGSLGTQRRQAFGAQRPYPPAFPAAAAGSDDNAAAARTPRSSFAVTVASGARQVRQWETENLRGGRSCEVS